MSTTSKPTPATSLNNAHLSNPRRRPRNASEDSVANRQPVKRRKRVGLGKETFLDPAAASAGTVESGHTNGNENENGHAGQEGLSAKRSVRDGTHIALRHRDRVGQRSGSGTARRTQRRDGVIELTRNENYIVTRIPATPAPLLDSLKAEKWNVEVFPQTGYAIALTKTQAVVWKFYHDNVAIDHLQTHRVRLLHPSSGAHDPLPLGILVQTASEPALLTIMPKTGKIVYWETLSAASNLDEDRHAQQAVQTTIPGLQSGELATKIIEAEPRGFVVAFSSGRLAHLTVGELHGRPTLELSFLRTGLPQATGLFGSLRGVLNLGGWKRDLAAAVKAGASVRRGQRDIVVATSTGGFQMWDLNWNGTHTLKFDIDAKTELLQALVDGGEVFEDRKPHDFEVLDFAILPANEKDTDLIRADHSPGCRVLALTVLKGGQLSKYALIGLTLVDETVQVDVVHPITCYQTTVSSNVAFRPQVLVPEPGQVAFVVFERSVVLVSLVEIDASPSSQLQLEAHTLPDPFQDAISFREDRPYRTVGCASLLPGRNDDQSTCVVMVHGYGMINLIALPMQKGQSALDRACVTVKTKIEQAVFFGGQQQDLLDFAPRPEVEYSDEDVEAAALSISHSVVSSKSPYLATIVPSMEQQLAKRAGVLAELIKYVRTHYPPLSPPARWQLLWDAEKMAAARALWKQYNSTMSAGEEGSKNVLAELVETIHTDYKKENQPESGEPDGVRHYFTHDIWRLEWLVPYAHSVIDLIAEESTEVDQPLDETTKARLTSDAIKIQTATLGTAFRFRQDHGVLYGISADLMSHGVLDNVDDFTGLPEPWTCSQVVTSRTKEMVQNAQATAKTLAESLDEEMNKEVLEEELDEPEVEAAVERTHQVMMELRSQNPEQVQMSSQTLLERARWLQSRDNAKERAEGIQFMRALLDVRRTQLLGLVDLELDEDAIRLAENYADMRALVDILVREIDNPKIAPSIPGRINRYFTRFGSRWSDAYFSHHLNDGREAVAVLTGSKAHQQQLTKYLRQHPSHARLAWINEISNEQDYFRAATSLRSAAKQESSLWSQKIMSSMSKLSLMAAKSTNQTPALAAEPEIRAINHKLALLAIQEEVHDVVSYHLADAIDEDARLDLAMARYGTAVMEDGKTPYLHKRLQQTLSQLLAQETLPPADLIDLLTLMRDDPIMPDQTELGGSLFFLALKALKLISAASADLSIPTQPSPVLSTMVWRRIFIASDWSGINHTEAKIDEDVKRQLHATPLYQTLLKGYQTIIPGKPRIPSANAAAANDDDDSGTANPPKTFWDTTPLYTPHEVMDESNSTLDSNPHKYSPDKESEEDREMVMVQADLQTETVRLNEAIQRGRLHEWFTGLVEDARSFAYNSTSVDLSVSAPQGPGQGQGMNGNGTGNGVSNIDTDDVFT